MIKQVSFDAPTSVDFPEVEDWIWTPPAKYATLDFTLLSTSLPRRVRVGVGPVAGAEAAVAEPEPEPEPAPASGAVDRSIASRRSALSAGLLPLEGM